MRLAPVFLALLLSGCATSLAPAPEATLAPGPGAGALARSGEIELVARAQTWRGNPENLDAVATPILVTLDNGSEATLRLRYEDFRLTAGGTVSHLAQGPMERRPVLLPVYRSGLHYHAPYFAVPYVLEPLGHGFFRDPLFDYGYYPSYVTVRLPTADMVAFALEEGVLEPGGVARGYLYFDVVPERDRRFVLEVDLVDHESGERLGTLTIPFVTS